MVEVRSRHITATEVGADFKNRRIKIFNSADFSTLKEFSLQLPKSAKVILSLSSDLATTVYGSVPIVREDSSHEIDEAEVDHLAAQSIRKFFDHERSDAALKMGIDDIFVALSDAKIWEVLIDGHPVIDPIGCCGGELVVKLSATFMPRKILEEIALSIPKSQIVLMVEGSIARARAVYESFRNVEAKPVIFIDIGYEATRISHIGPERIAYKDEIAWGSLSPEAALSREFLVTPEVAQYLTSIYNKQGFASPEFLQKIESIVGGEYNLLGESLIRQASRSEAEQLAIFAPYGLPLNFLKIKLRNAGGHKIKIILLPQGLFTEDFGFVVQLKHGLLNSAHHIVAHLIDYYIAPQQRLFNELAARRLRWWKTWTND